MSGLKATYQVFDFGKFLRRESFNLFLDIQLFGHSLLVLFQLSNFHFQLQLGLSLTHALGIFTTPQIMTLTVIFIHRDLFHRV